MKAKWNPLIVLALLFGLMGLRPNQHVSAADYVATFEFTSSLNPSVQYQAVTFTVSATGTDPNLPPIGDVTFYDNGEAILCEGDSGSYYQARLNVDGSGSPVYYIPAVCKTSALTPGLHTITAYFASLWHPSYDPETLTLADGQTVNSPEPLTIGPDTLPDGIYDGWYQQTFTATSDDGYSCGTGCQWSMQGTFPAGIYNYGSVGLIEGTPEQVGDFTFTITARDTTAGYQGSRTYSLTIDKATPQVAIRPIGTTPDEKLYLEVIVQHPTSYYTYPSGSVSFSVDGVPLEDCSGANAIPVGEWGYATCITPPPPDLTPGSYPLQVEFIPENDGYNSASANGTLIIPARIEGLLFEDLNQNGIREPGTEMPIPGSWWVSLDKDCDGTAERNMYTENNTGLFSFNYLAPGNYCLNVPLGSNWHQTTTLGEITLNEDRYFEIGFASVQLAFSPEQLPNGSVGEPYNQPIGVTGGDSPYSVNPLQVLLPAGLAFDQTNFTISGTPTAAGNGYLFLEFRDAGGAVGYYQSNFMIQTDGSFTLTSDANPSASGQAVTFTFTGSGDLVDLSLGGAFGPFGTVTFYDGESAVDGCVDVLLNFDLEYNVPVDLPATCTTSVLTDGSHEIRAAFASWSPYYDATRTLTQQVGLPSYTHFFLPIIMAP